jgi:hypothetical protein
MTHQWRDRRSMAVVAGVALFIFSARTVEDLRGPVVICGAIAAADILANFF